MTGGNRPWRPVIPAELDWCRGDDGVTDCPRSPTFGDVYYSREHGLRESDFVFLQGNDLVARMRRHPESGFCVGETGFGTGLNFLLTWNAWRELPAPRPRLHYVAVERFPLQREDLARALSPWRELQPLATALLADYPGLVPGTHRLLFDDGAVTLDLWWEDAAVALADLAGREERLVDAWYLDGFAPARNAAMWQPGLMQSIARLSRAGATFATFTAAGQVRRDLETAGFDVRKSAGFGRKRERLCGVLRCHPPPDPPGMTPWDLAASPATAPASALVIGGGLAGCTTAAALARRGVPVTLLERGSVAGEGSGNTQGVLYTRLSRRHSPLADFALAGFCFAARLYRRMLNSGQLEPRLDGALCGSFHPHDDTGEMAYLAAALAPVPELAAVVSANRAAALLGIEQPGSGYWFPGSGWLRPAAVCRALAGTPGVEVIEHCGDVRLERGGDAWQAVATGRPPRRAACVVLATGTSAAAHAGLEWLPVRAIRGQTTQLPTAPALSRLRAVLCHEGYIAPARMGEHCIGATFDLHDGCRETRAADHARNIEALAAAVPAWRGMLQALDPAVLSGRVSYRCASPDYLPIVGPVPDRDAFLAEFADLRKNARQTIVRRGHYMPGLYVNTAHGSRGLSSTPLAAEVLASHICGDPPPLRRELFRALSPARFLIRDLGRNRL